MKSAMVLAVLALLILFHGCSKPSAPSASSSSPKESTPAADAAAPESPEGEEEQLSEEAYPENPFRYRFVGTAPKSEVPESRFEFGELELGTTGEHDFVIRNVGTVPLKLAKGPTQCKCTLSGLRDQEILPGGEGKIHLAWTPVDEGDFEQSATIWTNDPDNKTVTLTVSGAMYPAVVIQPKNGWMLGGMQPNVAVPLMGLIASKVYDGFEVTKVETSSPLVKLEAIPLSPQECAESGYKCAYFLTGTAEPGESNNVSESVSIHTTLEKSPVIELKVTGSRTGPITLISPIWYSSDKLLQLGIVKSAAGKTYRVTLMIQASEQPLQFTEVKAFPSFVQVHLKQETASSIPGAKERYTMTIEIPKGCPPGNWNRPNFGNLTIMTNREDVPEVQLNLDLLVE